MSFHRSCWLGGAKRCELLCNFVNLQVFSLISSSSFKLMFHIATYRKLSSLPVDDIVDLSNVSFCTPSCTSFSIYTITSSGAGMHTV